MKTTKEQLNIEGIRANYIKAQQKLYAKLRKLTFSKFQSKNINCDQITPAYFNRFYKSLKLDNTKSIIYYFELASKYDINIIKESVKKYKKLHPAKNKLVDANYLALSRVNTNTSNILYVGKSVKNTEFRLSCHFGVGKNDFFSLHLNKWVCDLNMKKGLKLKFHYLFVDTKNNELVELFENTFHHQLKPILGRTGH